LFADAHEEGKDYKLLVVDSSTELFRINFQGRGRGELADRQQKLGQFLARLTQIAEEFDCAVLITNQVTADPGAASMFVQDAKKPIGGHVMAHACCTRLSLRKGRGEQRIMKIMDSPMLKESEAIYEIQQGGITDPTESNFLLSPTLLADLSRIRSSL